MKCKVCGAEIPENRYINNQELQEHQMCFSCNFWREMLEKDANRPPHTCCMIDGTHYVIGPEDDSSQFRGFGGAKFQIIFDDGTKVDTTNLWCQGEPEDEYWKNKFPNNAHFNWKWKQIGKTKYLIRDED